MSSATVVAAPEPSAELPTHHSRRKRTVKRSLLFSALLIILVSVFTVLGVSQIMELGSVAFFLVVVAGVLVLLLFFCGLIAYARAKLISVHGIGQGEDSQSPIQSVPVFYYLQTIHRPIALEPVNDDNYWLKDDFSGEKIHTDSAFGKDCEQCPICLCEIDHDATATGISACCKRQLHVKCAQDYFNSIRHVKCVFCRRNIDEPQNAPDVDTTAATPSPLTSPRTPQV